VRGELGQIEGFHQCLVTPDLSVLFFKSLGVRHPSDDLPMFPRSALKHGS